MRLFSLLILMLISLVQFGQVADTTDVFSEFPDVTEDSLIIINPKNTPVIILNKTKSDAFYDSLEIKSNNKPWTKQLHQLLVKKELNSQVSKKDDNPIEYFEPYTGKYIRDITFMQLDVFGPSVFDTNKKATLWSQNLGNNLHVSTSKSSLKNYLFIAENEKVDPYILADNERILRSIPSIQDVRIYIVPIESSSDSVDIRIVTKDVWPVGFGFETLDVTYGNISLWNKNVLGLGDEIFFKLHYNGNEDPKYGFMGKYKISNIINTLASLELSHEEKWNINSNRIILKRDFITPAIRLGLGANYEKINERRDIITINNTFFDTIDFEYYNAWLAYSFPFGNQNQQKIRKTFFISTRAHSYNFFGPDITNENYLYRFFDRRVFLSSFGLTWQGYYNTRLVLGFGDTEDIPYGAMAKVTAGKEFNEYAERYYLGATLTFSHYIDNLGFVSNKFEGGSFYYNNRIEQGSFYYAGSYISPIFGTQRHFFRTFIGLNYEQGYKRYEDEYIELTNREGLRGINYSGLKGSKRGYINTELVYYSPHYLYGFRFVYYTFADIGMINYSHSTLIKNPINSSIGIGMRVRNERLVFNTLQLQFQFFPFETEIPRNSKQYVDASGMPRLRIPEFANRVPEIIEY